MAKDQVSGLISYQTGLSNYCHLQPIQALEHAKFKELVDVASCTKNGVDILGQKATRSEIKLIFKDYLGGLRSKLNVRVFYSSVDTLHFLHILHLLSKASSA